MNPFSTPEQQQKIRNLKAQNEKLGMGEFEFAELLRPFGVDSEKKLSFEAAKKLIAELELLDPALHINSLLDYIRPNGQVFELCLIGPKQPTCYLWEGFARGQKATVSGWFDDDKKAIEIITGIAPVSPTGIFVTLNPCDRALLSRANCRLIAGINRTADAEIISIDHLLIDVDPKRPTGISSTYEEHNAALELAKQIIKGLSEQGWPDPLFGDSGNGAHLIYKLLSLKNLRENVELVKRCLKTLNARYSDEKLEIDEAVYNPARLSKLYGTHVRKGDDTPERPHRLAKIISVPDTPQSVSLAQLEALASLRTDEPNIQEHTHDITEKHSPQSFDLEAYLKHYGISIKTTKRHGDSTLWVLNECLFDSGHGPGESSVGQTDQGTLFYQCFHDTCKKRTWHDARKKISGETVLTRFTKNHQEAPSNAITFSHAVPHSFRVGQIVQANDRKNYGRVVSVSAEQVVVHFRNPRTGYDATVPFHHSQLTPLNDTYRFLHTTDAEIVLKTMGEIHRTQMNFRPPVIDGALDDGDSLLTTGPSGLGKSLIQKRIALAVASGKPLFNRFEIPMPRTVLFLQSENTMKATKQRLAAMLASLEGCKDFHEYEAALDRIITPVIGNDCRFSGDIHDPGFLDELATMITKTKAGLLILDPLISFHTENENDNVKMRSALDCLTWLSKETGVAHSIVHHHGKGEYQGMAASRGATAITDWASCVWTLMPEGKGHHPIIRCENTKNRNFPKAQTFALEVQGACVVPVERDVICPPSRVVSVLEDLGGRAKSKNQLTQALIDSCEVSRRTAQEAIDRAVKSGGIWLIENGRPKSYTLPGYSEASDDEDAP